MDTGIEGHAGSSDRAGVGDDRSGNGGTLLLLLLLLLPLPLFLLPLHTLSGQ
jgi:hypothetical protein